MKEKDAYYFKHDAYARHDPKIKSMMNKYGAQGYGRFWIVIEMLRESRTYKLEYEDYLWETLAEEMKCSVQDAQDFINDCINKYKLFIKDDTFFYSASLLSRMIKLDETRDKRKFAANVKHGKETRNHWND